MKKKITLLLLAITCSLCCALGLAACGDNNEPKVNGLVIAKTGEQPDHGQQWVNTTITYGETPDLTFYKLYLYYDNGDLKELALNDNKLTVVYSRFESGTSKTIEKLPDEYLAGSYSIEYVYDGKTDSMYKATATINVSKAESGAFSVQPAKSAWYENETNPSVIVKNPKALAVQYENAQLNTDDSNGLYYLHYVDKAVYDTFTEAQKTDYDFISNCSDVKDYDPIIGNCPIGEYMLFAEIDSTHNYSHVITPAVGITVKNAFIERTFTLQSIAVQDSDGNPVTDTENEFVNMAESMNTYNQGKTVICKANGEVRGTVDFGAGVFDELTAEDVYKYEASYEYLALHTQDDEFVGDGNLSGNTLTIKMSTGTPYYFIITFIGQ